MSRPFTTYFISLWLAVWLIGLPLHNRDLLVSQFGPYLTVLFLVIVSLAVLVISIQFVQCHPVYVGLTLVFLTVHLGYLITRIIWVMTHGGFVQFPLLALVVLGVDLYCVTYLMTPSTQARIRHARRSLLTRTSPSAAHKED